MKPEAKILEHARIIDKGWSHPYTCACDTCLSSWALVGPDGDEPGSYGPFTVEQVNARQRMLDVKGTE